MEFIVAPDELKTFTFRDNNNYPYTNHSLNSLHVISIIASEYRDNPCIDFTTTDGEYTWVVPNDKYSYQGAVEIRDSILKQIEDGHTHPKLKIQYSNRLTG